MDSNDAACRYCKLLGHDVPFSYCCRPGSGTFCRNIVGCWNGKLDVERFVRENYTESQIAAAMGPPKEKVTTLVELIQRSRERA